MSAVLRHPSRPPPPLLPQRIPYSHHLFHVLPIKSPSQKIVALCSSSSMREPFSVLAEEPSPPSEVTASPGIDSLDGMEKITHFRGCKTCGRGEIERGCNGEGRIQGGIATVPGFGWWPIKAFRPCPGFIASGGRYRRRGQSMDEVAFGRTERGISVKLSDKAKSSKKNQVPSKLNG